MSEDFHQICVRERFYKRDKRNVFAARRFVRKALVDWKINQRTDDVLLCASELVTNAILHGVPPGRGFYLYLWLTTDAVLRLEVHDSGDGHPRLRDPGADEAGGRGLWLVEAMSDCWGVGARDPGKVVWCEFVLDPDTIGDRLGPPPGWRMGGGKPML
ncbi:ATP-binding protein [Streptomyces harbinensis]|uniref:ATP-binding protein n=1 Tax=Streptomyces harbinensis TaxID=1176198 RepID=UPI00371AB883